MLPSEVATARTRALAHEALQLDVEVHRDAGLGPGLLDRLDDVGVGELAERPRAGVDDVGLDAAMGSAVTISSPSGVASTTTAACTASRTLSHSIARRMFFT